MKFLIHKFYTHEDCEKSLGVVFTEQQFQNRCDFGEKTFITEKLEEIITGSNWYIEIKQEMPYSEHEYYMSYLRFPWYFPWYYGAPIPYWSGPIEIYIVFHDPIDAAFFKMCY